MALLEMVNSVRGKLREERIAAISSSDLLTTEVIDLINDAASEILEANNWTFDVRHDGQFYWPKKDSGTSANFGSLTKFPYDDHTEISLFYAGDESAGEVFADKDMTGYRMTHPFQSRIYPTSAGSTDSGLVFDTTWVLSDVLYQATQFTLTTAYPFRSPSSFTGSWTFYSAEQVLPTTVREVLSVRNEEQDIPVEFVDRSVHFENLIPRHHNEFNDNTEVIFVGSTVTSTGRSGSWPNLPAATVTTGTGAMIWPVPVSDQHLNYSYRVQHSDLSAATDAFTGVTKNVIHLIEWRAVQMAYESGIQNDVQRAQQAERQVEKRLLRALAADGAQPNRRRVPTEFRAYSHHNSRRRWATQVTPTP